MILSHGSMLKLTHITNFYHATSSEHCLAQDVTAESMRRAADFARRDCAVELKGVVSRNEIEAVPKGFCKARPLDRTIVDIGHFAPIRPYPLLRDILDRGSERCEADYLIYTNADIALMPHFYVAVCQIINAGHDSFSITRRTIADRPFTSPSQLPAMYSAVGRKHPGLDCFVFARDKYAQFILGDLCLGIPGVGKALQLNLIAFGDSLAGGENGVIRDGHLTFHLGDSQVYRNPVLRDYHRHNARELILQLSRMRKSNLRRETPMFSQTEHQMTGVLKKYPASPQDRQRV